MRASHLLAPAVVLATGGSIAGPRSIRRLARRGVGLYGACLVVPGVRSLTAVDSWGDAALVPVVLLVMHYAHGLGQIQGWVKHGPPLAALACICRCEGLVDGLAGAAGPVHAPSLHLDQAAPGRLADNPPAESDTVLADREPSRVSTAPTADSGESNRGG
jgi:hypothetical protein